MPLPLARPLWRLGLLSLAMALLLTLPLAKAAWSMPLDGAVTPQLRPAVALIATRVEDMPPQTRRAYILESIALTSMREAPLE